MPSARLSDIQHHLASRYDIGLSCRWLSKLRKRYRRPTSSARPGEIGGPASARAAGVAFSDRLLSVQGARIFEVLDEDAWRTVAQISRLSGAERRTVRAHLLCWRRRGIVEMARTFPPCYRRRPLANNGEEVKELTRLCGVRLTLGEEI
jgi:hypothetical protein